MPPFSKKELSSAMLGNKKAYSEWKDQNTEPFYKADGTQIGVVIKKDNKLFICFRGTKTLEEAINDLNIKHSPITSKNGVPIHVHKGFHDLYKDCEESMNEAIAELEDDSIKEIVFTGHSAGAALSQVASLTHKLKKPDANVKNIAFGGPRVFFKNGAQEYNKHLGSNTLLVQQNGDPVVHLPPPPLFSHAGYHRIKMSVTDKSLDIHQPGAYKNISDNITDDVLQTTHAKAIKIEERMNLIQNRNNFGKEIRNDRSERIKEALKEAYKLNIRESLSIILDGSTRNSYRTKQKTIDKTLRNR